MTKILLAPLLAALLVATPVHAEPPISSYLAADYLADARAIPDLIAANYAYMDDLPGGVVPHSAMLDAEREAVHDHDSLLHYAEDMITVLADHHALTQNSFNDDWALVPTYADLWLVRTNNAYVVDAVKPGSPADLAGIQRGDRLTTIDDTPIDTAVTAFWSRLGLEASGERAPYAARVLAAGRRDCDRHLTLTNAAGQTRALTLPSLYSLQADLPPIMVIPGAKGAVTIRFNNDLGDSATITAFDAAMAAIAPRATVTLDLSDTPSGGNTSVARAVMGWFVTKAMPYQVHNLPAEERETGIARQWIEEVLPRPGKYHPGPVRVIAGRWTGSLGEGLAVGFMALGKPVCSTASSSRKMAGLKGAVYDFDLPKTGLRIKFPAERLYTVSGQPREDVVLPACSTPAAKRRL